MIIVLDLMVIIADDNILTYLKVAKKSRLKFSPHKEEMVPM